MSQIAELTRQVTKFSMEDKRAILLDYKNSDMSANSFAQARNMSASTLYYWTHSPSILAAAGFSLADFEHRHHAPKAKPHTQVDSMAQIVQDTGMPQRNRAPIDYEDVPLPPNMVHANFCPNCGLNVREVGIGMTASASK